MYARSVLVPALAGMLSAVHAAQSMPVGDLASHIFARQMNSNSTCSAYGIDFQDGGSYFINTNSNQSFTCVTKFEGCNNDKADIMLVNEASGDEYDCTQVATVPDDEAMMSTCPILKSQITSGEYLILVLGNNGNGNPFAYQREFSIDAAPQSTSTVASTVTYTVTMQSTVKATSTSTVKYTSTISNNSTITLPAATNVITKTPAEVTVTSTKMHTQTFTRWTKTQSIDTVVVTPQCTIPPRPRFPDPVCSWIPKNHPLPFGLHLKARADKPADPEVVRKRFENMRAAKARAVMERDAQITPAPHVKRDADQPTVTITADQPINSTITITASPTTDLETAITSDISYYTQPPSTVRSGTEVDTTYAPTPTDTVRTVAYTRAYTTKTWAVTWTYTTTTTPAAHATSCVQKGGHFGPGWGIFQPH